MTALRNPFRPGFGHSPTYLAGRAELLTHFKLSLLEGPGAQYRSILVSGQRGVGKTVLLNEIEDEARQQGWIVLRARPEGSMIEELVDTTIPLAIATVVNPPQRRISGGGIAGLGNVTTETHPRADALRAQPTLITRLQELSDAIPTAGILITLDEVQAADVAQLHLLATAVQDLMRDDHDIAFVCAGLPHGVSELLQHDGTTFLRRAFRLTLTGVPDSEVAAALHKTAAASGLPFSDAGLNTATPLCRGYPYLIQLVGSLSWAQAMLDGRPAIEASHVEAVSGPVIQRLGQQVHEPALRRIPDRELEYLRAMARLLDGSGEDAARTGDIAAALGAGSPNALSVYRQRLIDRDLIAPEGFGKVTFTLPYLTEYILSQEG